MPDAVTIQVNGENRETPAGTTVTTLLAQLGLNSGRVAIEYNLQILPKSKWEETALKSSNSLAVAKHIPRPGVGPSNAFQQMPHLLFLRLQISSRNF